MGKAEDFDTRWPKDGDRLFVKSSSASDAPLVRDPRERFYRLPMGYKRAGDILVEQAATDVADRRNIIYAALFCYRHSIELYLKTLIDEFGDDPVNTHHDLKRLWDVLMCIVNEHGCGESLGLDAARTLVLEMHEVDKKSDGFRFPTGRNGSLVGFGDKGIDLDNVREVMQGLANFFECADLGFSYPR